MDNDIFDLPQEDLEQHIYRCIQEEGFSDTEINRFKLVNRFQQSRNPLIIFMCGLPCETKTRLAQELGHRLQVPNVLKTDDIEHILCAHPAVDMNRTMNRSISDMSLTESSIIEEYQKECAIISQAIEHDVLKAFKDGKSIIIEGFHLDPEYIVDNLMDRYKHKIVDGIITMVRGIDGEPIAQTSDGIRDADSHHHALVVPVLIHMDPQQYELDSQYLWTTTEHTLEPFHTPLPPHSTIVTDRMHSTLGGYLMDACTSRSIPMVQVDMASWDKALEQLHEYILKGIEITMMDTVDSFLIHCDSSSEPQAPAFGKD